MGILLLSRHVVAAYHGPSYAHIGPYVSAFLARFIGLSHPGEVSGSFMISGCAQRVYWIYTRPQNFTVMFGVL